MPQSAAHLHECIALVQVKYATKLIRHYCGHASDGGATNAAHVGGVGHRNLLCQRFQDTVDDVHMGPAAYSNDVKLRQALRRSAKNIITHVRRNIATCEVSSCPKNALLYGLSLIQKTVHSANHGIEFNSVSSLVTK